MNIQEITNKTQWQEFFDEAGSPSFLQSWEWGELEEKMGYEIKEIPVYWKNDLESKVKFKSILKIALDLFVIKLNSLRGFYGKKKKI